MIRLGNRSWIEEDDQLLVGRVDDEDEDKDEDKDEDEDE